MTNGKLVVTLAELVADENVVVDEVTFRRLTLAALLELYEQQQALRKMFYALALAAAAGLVGSGVDMVKLIGAILGGVQ